MQRLTPVVFGCAIAMIGCASSTKDISTNYVSPVQFQSYDCNQLQSEAVRIQSRVSQLGGRIDEAANNDKAITGVGMILFWPALFALGGNKQQEADYGRLKGEYEAIQQSAIEKRCGQVVQQPAVVNATASAAAQSPPVTGTPSKSSEEKLKELKKLFDAGLISPEVYSDRQKAILGS